MAKKNKSNRKPTQQRRGTAKPVDVAVGRPGGGRAFLATIENNGRDNDGSIIGANGIRWVA